MPNGTEVAEQFGNLIAKADYSTAHALLTNEAQKIHSPADFKEAVEQMTAYAPGPIQEVKVMSDYMVTDWPAKQDGDIAVIYVALSGSDFCEAVTLTVAHEESVLRIRDLEWGRP